ncbi:hypothetical protein MPDQ_007401 [Monascus purpureus]|uniref:Mid2 domain-containing protein n=1 Tax=Monascus purpureus TaxID=5098 RepID=A0A507QW03_MONPU|nr:hypothetical protein MPDQ_007401 [Monascus purpureus]BDD57055.1 hypothetical protein MAP00_002456 [Monascus purpureus]
MAYHDNLRHHRISRSLKRKRREEAGQAGNTAGDEENQRDPPVSKILQATVVSWSSAREELEGRGSKDDNTQAEIVSHEPTVLLEARTQEPLTTATVVQVIGGDSETIGEYTGVTLPFTLSNSVYGSLTISAPKSLPPDAASSSSSFPPEPSVSASPAYSSPAAETPSLTRESHTLMSPSPSTPLISPSRASPTPTSSTSTSSSTTPSSTTVTSSSTIASSSISSTSSSTSLTTSSSTYYGFPSSGSTGGSSGNIIGAGGGLGGSTITSEPPASATSTQSLHGATTPNNTTPKIVGGVVGGVAGLFVLALLAGLLFLYRRKRSIRGTPSGLPSDGGSRDAPLAERPSTTRSAEMSSQRSSQSLFTAAYLAPAFMRRWRNSAMTDSSQLSETSERGFQKISGRKIPSVLQSGGDGYGGGLEGISPTISPMSGDPSSSRSVRPPQSPPQSPPSQPPPTRPFGVPLDTSFTRESSAESNAVVVIRPSPARTPLSSTVSVVSPEHMSPARPSSQRPDLLGRSRPSLDGSRSSRFTEGI